MSLFSLSLYFALSALIFLEILLLPGPLAQAIALRAFGALAKRKSTVTQAQTFLSIAALRHSNQTVPVYDRPLRLPLRAHRG